MLLLIFLVVLHGADLPNGILFLLGYAAFLKTIVLHLPFRKRRNYVAYLVLGHILLVLLFQLLILLDFFLHENHFFSLFLLNLVMIFLILFSICRFVVQDHVDPFLNTYNTLFVVRRMFYSFILLSVVLIT